MIISAVSPGESPLRLPPRGGVLVFDGYCGFCTRSVHWLGRLDRRGRIRALPLQGRRVLELAGLTRDEAMAAAWWIGTDGQRERGAGAINAALAAATGIAAFRVLYRVPGLRWLQDRAYRWIAEHRRLLRGATPHCIDHSEADCGA